MKPRDATVKVITGLITPVQLRRVRRQHTQAAPVDPELQVADGDPVGDRGVLREVAGVVPAVSAARKVTVRVLPGRVLHTHPEHEDGLRAPSAEALSNGGIATASAERHGPGDAVELHPDAAAGLVAAGVVERA